MELVDEQRLCSKVTGVEGKTVALVLFCTLNDNGCWVDCQVFSSFFFFLRPVALMALNWIGFNGFYRLARLPNKKSNQFIRRHGSVRVACAWLVRLSPSTVCRWLLQLFQWKIAFNSIARLQLSAVYRSSCQIQSLSIFGLSDRLWMRASFNRIAKFTCTVAVTFFSVSGGPFIQSAVSTSITSTPCQSNWPVPMLSSRFKLIAAGLFHCVWWDLAPESNKTVNSTCCLCSSLPNVEMEQFQWLKSTHRLLILQFKLRKDSGMDEMDVVAEGEDLSYLGRGLSCHDLR